MSSLAAARADNFYYPPGWDPSKGSINKFQGQHPLRERAKKLGEGILIIRFEMPFNVWCGKCNHLIGKGVRFNAEKKAIGNYHTTKIWSFKMTAPCCQNRIEIHTDPKNARYIIVSGAKQKEETWTAEDAETMELPDSADRPKLDDPLYKLEHGNEDARRGKEGRERVAELYVDSASKFRDDYAANKLLRKAMRAKRKEAKQTQARHKALGLPDSVPLLPETPDDARRAELMTFGDDRAFEKAKQLKRQEIRSSSIFSAPPPPRVVSHSRRSSPAPSRGTGSRLGPSGGGVAKTSSTGAAKANSSGRRRPESRTAKAQRLLGLGVKLGLSNPS